MPTPTNCERKKTDAVERPASHGPTNVEVHESSSQHGSITPAHMGEPPCDSCVFHQQSSHGTATFSKRRAPLGAPVAMSTALVTHLPMLVTVASRMANAYQ